MVKTMKKITCDPYSRSRRKGLILGLPLALLTFSLLPYLTQGLTCYECLSLSCDSGAICESIKEMMVKIFVPKSHFIHFDPREQCPESENPNGDSPVWANLSRECHRSDSLCLTAPIEVQTAFDGMKSGEKLESPSLMSSVGYLRGCASRRKLLEIEDTIKVEVTVTNDSLKTSNGNHSRKNHNGSNGHSNNSSNGGSVPQKHAHDNHRHHQQQQNHNSAMNNAVFDFEAKNEGATNNDPGSRHSQLLNNNSFGDGYIITKIYSHVFYIDQGTSNATRCFVDNCNNRIKHRRSGAISVTFMGITSLVYYAAVLTNCLRYY